ncbi:MULTISPECIES: hypothetical protein [unclassified Paenibacillus]|uniref:hypothetical protein n=1 Tax=unclassified Paenibacillus TaxID=185978 RepID=UPI001AE40ADE|nr:MULTISPECIES: hypothetical protein [unclassified Paenibacillus]MBP1153932.1 hypothetical protein [Paenibacillus sp. PvP091]MBP1170683.1 hypothetical protein [Paenibacillus sp. PvR098]MBP2441711.1 hypothetical protein [Paenibacillus sp. PvP052]
MVIVYKVGLTDEQKLAVRASVNDLENDEFVILCTNNEAIYGKMKAGRVLIKEVLKYV